MEDGGEPMTKAQKRYQEWKGLSPEEKAARRQAHASKRAAAQAKRQERAQRLAKFQRYRAPASARLAALSAARAQLEADNAIQPVDRVGARAAQLESARRRERQRIDHLVLGQPRPGEVTEARKGKRGKGRKAVRISRAPKKLEPGIEEAVALRERFDHKVNATPETLAHAERAHLDSLIQMERNGTIDREQLEWAAEIANVHRSIESDVTIGNASLEARVDCSGSGKDMAGEGVRRVRLHMAYGTWRALLPLPKQLVLDMIVGDRIGYTVAARRYAVWKGKAKRLLIEALDRWPECVDDAYRAVSDEDIRAAQEALR